MIARLSPIAAAAALLAQPAGAQEHGQAFEHEEMAEPYHLYTILDRFEAQWPDDGDAGFLWDAQGWYGGDINKLWWKSEGFIADGEVDDAELQLLYSRAIAPFFDLQAGLRYDFEPDGLAHAVLGVQGLAPYWFEIDAAAFLSEEGDVTARFEAEYDLLITQRLVLQPRAELGLALDDVPSRDLGSGFTDIDLGLRLRYEIRRELAPYVGVSWTRALGETADLVRAAGEDDESLSVVAGVRIWF